MEKEHGFTEYEEWAEYFKIYTDRILSIEKLTSFSSAHYQDGAHWLTLYKKRALCLREMYLDNEKYLERHLYWFIKNPEHWEADVAASLLDYLFRNSIRIEDIEATQKTAESLYNYYQQADNEIAMMKCTLIILTNRIMLDFPHNKEQILSLCEWAIDVYERNYDQLNAVERSMGLSFYDYESNACSEYVIFDPIISPETLIKLYQRRMRHIERFIAEEDLSLRVNHIVPYLRVCWQCGFVGIPIKAKHTAFTAEQLAMFYEVCGQMENETQAGSIQDVKVCLIKLMLTYQEQGLDKDQVMAELIRLQNMLPKPTMTYDDELMDALQILSCAIRIIAKDDKKYQAEVKGILQILLDAYLCLPNDNYIEHITDNAIFLYMFPLLNVLPADEILRITLFLTIFRQPQTAAHTIMVGKLATTIVAAMIDKTPALFMRMSCFSSIAHVQDNRQKIIDYVGEAALLHDVGKILSSNVINMQYRRLIDLEFEAIKLHPISSGEILKQIPTIADFYDIAVGHHKSYDGQKGYPIDFDNLHSPQKLFIDLITICDTLDAATDNLGRNYACTKQFKEVLEELNSEKGSRYSDSIVDLILNDDELQIQLEELLNSREESYRQVFEIIDSELREFQTKQTI